MESNDQALKLTDIARMIDHAILRPDLQTEEFLLGIGLCREYGVATASVRPMDVIEAKRRLEDSGVKVSVMVGFPHGSNTCETKLFETKLAMDSGADEIEVVMNIGRWKSGDVAYVERELRSIIEEVTSRDGITKVILENYYLTNEEIQAATGVCERVGADFVVNSTGFAPANVHLRDVEAFTQMVSQGMGIKVAGGINALDQLLRYRELGVSRIGTLATHQILVEAADRFQG